MRIERTASFNREYDKLFYRNRALHEQIEKKVEHIVEHPEHYKPLRGNMKGMRRVHFGSYVLIYKIKGEELQLIALDHHDFIYR